MATPDLDDYHWLTSPDTALLLNDLQQQLGSGGQIDVRLAANLRKSQSSSRTHLLLEQIELRNRARDKFANPWNLFFTRKGLEQCTDELLAKYKARRYPQNQPIADLCCGIGGDALALKSRGSVVGYDLDPITAHFASCNLCSASNGAVRVECAAADRSAVQDAAAWHCDPDRRATGQRTIQLADYEPAPVLLHELLEVNPQAAVKVAPATELNPREWPACEREWLGSRGECRQQVLWFGGLSQQSGQHVATIVAADLQVSSFAGSPDQPLELTDQAQAFVYEPDATILAAHLAGAFAAANQLAALTPGGGYLTSDQPIVESVPGSNMCSLLAAFRVRDVLPYDIKKLKAYCREHRLGQLEIKKRGVDLQPHHLRRQIHSGGDVAAVILIAPIGQSVQAIVAERC